MAPEKINSISDFEHLSMNQLVAWHNHYCSEKEKVKEFRTKEAGRVKCRVMFERQEEFKQFEEETADMTDEEFQRFVMGELSKGSDKNSSATESVRKAIEESTMAQDVHLRSVSLANPARSAIREVLRKNGPGVRESWKDPALHARRTMRNHVFVSWDNKREEFRSVREAFEKLGLPIKSHIRFRGKLKIEGERMFSFDGEDYFFEVIERETK